MTCLGFDWLHGFLLLMLIGEWWAISRLFGLVATLRRGVDARQAQLHQSWGLVDQQSKLIGALLEKLRGAA